MRVLWIEDEGGEGRHSVAGAEIQKVVTLGDAEHVLSSGEWTPDWVLVDIIVPQGTWGQRTVRRAGRDFVSFLNEHDYGARIAVLTHLLSDSLKEDLEARGAERIFSKAQTGLPEVVRQLGTTEAEQRDSEPADA